MRREGWIVFACQVLLMLAGAKLSPDYYARTSETVRAWAWSSGLWILILNAAATLAIGYWLSKKATAPGVFLVVLSSAITGIWIVITMAISYLGDVIYWRFP